MLPPNHPLRVDLANEVHARPTEGIEAPALLVYFVLASDAQRRDADWTEARTLFERMGQPTPDVPVTHRVVSFGRVRLVLERHNEFMRYTVVAPATPDATDTVQRLVSEIGTLTGQLLVATRVHVLDGHLWTDADFDGVATKYFGASVVVGATLADGTSRALTDFRIDADGFSQVVVLADGMRPRQLGRMIQRLLEIDTYRMMALLSLPTARALRPQIEDMDRELAEIASGIAKTDTRQESLLLEQLTRLEARVQNALGASHYRFSASAAYEDLVMQRIADLRERRIEGLQTFHEFTSRRLAPAMATCRTTAANLKDLSQRVAQVTDLLATRVEIVREKQNRELLSAMARRAKLQLRLQRAVEGLSVVAVSYYVLGLVSYALKGLKGAGISFNVDLATLLLMPVVFAGVVIGLRRLVRPSEAE